MRSWKAGVCPQVPRTDPSTVNTGLTQLSNQCPLPASQFGSQHYGSSGPLDHPSPAASNGLLCSEPPPNCLLDSSVPHIPTDQPPVPNCLQAQVKSKQLLTTPCPSAELVPSMSCPLNHKFSGVETSYFSSP